MALRVSSRRKPFPYDIHVNNVGCMLKPNAEGQLVGRQAQPLRADPTTYEYGSASPFLEKTDPFNDIKGGYGQAVQHPNPTSRSYYCINVDQSINGKAIKGPLFNLETVTSGGSDNAIRGIFKGLHAGSETIFVLAGRKVYRGDGGGTWTQSVDLPTLTGNGSILPTGSTARFKDAGASPVDTLYIGVNLGNMVRYDGTTWHLSVAGNPADSGTPDLLNQQAQYYESVGDELYVGANNYIAKVEAEPWLKTKYAGPIAIGDSSRPITWMRQNQNELFIIKTNGIYTISTAALDKEIYPGLRVTPSLDNGVNSIVWLNSLWVPFHDNFFKIETDGTISNVGSELLLDNTSEVRGRTVAASGHNSWFLYEGLYNEQLGNSYLLKYGSWYDSEDARLATPIQYKNVHNGALKKWKGKQITWLGVISFSPNDRLYAGFSDGTIEWCVLPRVPNPAMDSNCRFTGEESYVYAPRHHANFQADEKTTRGFSAYGVLDPINHVEIEYRTSDSADFSGLASIAESDYVIIRSGMDGITNGTNTFTSSTAAFTSGDLNRDIVIGGRRRQISQINSGTSILFTGDTIVTATSVTWSINISAKSVFTANSQRIDFPEGQHVIAKSIDIRYKLTNKNLPGDAADTSSTPIVEGIGIHEQVRPAFLLEWVITILAKNYLARHDGSVDLRPANQIRQAILAAVSSVGTAEVLLPQEETQELSMVNYSEALIPFNMRHGIEWEITMQGVEFRTLTTQTTGGGDLPTGYTYEDLEAYTYAELESLI